MPKAKGDKPMSKAQLMSELAEKNKMTKKAVEDLFDSLYAIIQRELRSKGEITPLPGLVAFKKAIKKATPAKEGRNPRTGEPMMIKAKPQRTVAKASVRKGLKDMVA